MIYFSYLSYSHHFGFVLMASAAASLFLPFAKKNNVVEIQSIKGDRKTLLKES